MRDLAKIRELVGNISREQVQHVDCAVSTYVGVFMPVTGPCKYARMPAHTHPGYSFVVAFDDYCRIRLDGTDLTPASGSLTAISPDVPHQELSGDRISRYVAVVIDARYFRELCRAYEGIDPDTVFRGDEFTSSERLVYELKEFLAEYAQALPGYESLLEATGQKITHLIIRTVFDTGFREEQFFSRMSVNRAVNFINASYGEKITVVDMARSACLSPSHFSRVFKEEMGMGPAEYLSQVRLDRARRLLVSTEMSASRIALQCGYNSSAYFSSCFAGKFKLTPSEFRRTFSAEK